MATNFEVLGLPGGDIQYEYNRSFFALFATSGTGGDGSPPVVSLVSPGEIIDAGQPIVVDVVDPHLGRVFVVARYPSTGKEELVHQGDRFTTEFNGQSTRAPITNGFRFTLRRSGGWPASPIIEVYAFDSTGRET